MFQLRQLSLPYHPPAPPITLPPTKKEEGKSGSFCLGILLGGIFLPLFHTHSEEREENGSATSVFPFSSTVMNRELCKQWSNLRTGKLDGQSGGPVLFA